MKNSTEISETQRDTSSSRDRDLYAYRRITLSSNVISETTYGCSIRDSNQRVSSRFSRVLPSRLLRASLRKSVTCKRAARDSTGGKRHGSVKRIARERKRVVT